MPSVVLVDATPHIKKLEAQNAALQKQNAALRDALTYMIKVRGIGCTAHVPGPDSICALCRANAALAPVQQSAGDKGGNADGIV